MHIKSLHIIIIIIFLLNIFCCVLRWVKGKLRIRFVLHGSASPITGVGRLYVLFWPSVVFVWRRIYVFTSLAAGDARNVRTQTVATCDCGAANRRLRRALQRVVYDTNTSAAQPRNNDDTDPDTPPPLKIPLSDFHYHYLYLLSLVQSFILNLRLCSLVHPFFHRSFPHLPDRLHGLSDHLTFFVYSAA